MTATVHIVPGNNMWKLKKKGRVMSKHRTQQTAINAARRKLNVGTSVVVHGVNGKIRNEFTVRGG